MTPNDRPPLDPAPEEMRRLGYAAIDRLVDHFSSLKDQRVAKRGSAADFAAMVDEPLPQEGLGPDSTLDFFFQSIVPGMTRVNHPRFHAYIPCPSSFWGALGEILTAGTNPFTGSWLGGGTVSSLELTVIRWICEAIGYAPTSAGILTSGGSIANLVCLAAARYRFGREVLDRGIVYVSEEGHHSVSKAAEVLGFRRENIHSIAVDERFRMDLGDLRTQVDRDREGGMIPFFVCANAGSTNTGSIDPLEELANYCEGEGFWFHVDGAYGGFAALTEEGRDKLRGFERADSLTLDPHKWMFAPMGVGCALVRSREFLEGAFRGDAHYLQDIPRDEVNFFDRGPELSRPGRVISVWTLMRAAGVKALREQVRWDLLLAKEVEGRIAAHPAFEIVCTADLSVVTFRHIQKPGEIEDQRAARDTELMERTLNQGSAMLSTTRLQGQSALRLVVMNHRTDREQVERTLATLFDHVCE